MKAQCSATEIEVRAAEALSILLQQVSSIKTKDIRFQKAGSHRVGEILADIDVLGRSHQLVCNVVGAQPAQVRRAVQKLRACVNTAAVEATAVLIAPHLSSHTKALCEQSHIGFLDLEGNARLVVDDVFISKRCVRGEIPDSRAARLSA